MASLLVGVFDFGFCSVSTDLYPQIHVDNSATLSKVLEQYKKKMKNFHFRK